MTRPRLRDPVSALYQWFCLYRNLRLAHLVHSVDAIDDCVGFQRQKLVENTSLDRDALRSLEIAQALASGPNPNRASRNERKMVIHVGMLRQTRATFRHDRPVNEQIVGHLDDNLNGHAARIVTIIAILSALPPFSTEWVTLLSNSQHSPSRMFTSSFMHLLMHHGLDFMIA